VNLANRFTVILDACVLYSAPVRDLLLWMAAEDLFRPRWTEEIHKEWIRALLENRPDIDAARLDRLKNMMNSKFPDSEVTGYEPLIDALRLPDPKDRHVLAAAIVCNADAIVTFNVGDFPSASLSPYQVEAVDTDDFALSQIELSPSAITAAKNCRANLTRNPKTADEFADTLERSGLPQTAAELRKYRGVI
jgi:hypothetical protein